MRPYLLVLLLSGFSVLLLRCTGVTIANQQQSEEELGRLLFFDTRLSYNNTKSCASCHDPKFAFSDGYRRSITASGDIVKHNAPSLINAVLLHFYDWNNDTITSLHQQSERPLFNKQPIELGAGLDEKKILAKISADDRYQQLFTSAFSSDKSPINFNNIRTALQGFVKTLSSSNATYDRYMAGDTNALSASAKQGLKLFFSDRLHCASCHQPPMFTSNTSKHAPDSIYFNTGLYNVDNSSFYPVNDQGLREFSKDSNDDGRFKTPGLRNLAFTAPYTHDGSVASIEEMIDIYARGGRKIDHGPLKGDGKLNNRKNTLINGFELSSAEKKQLIDFLFSLSDSSVIINPAFQAIRR